MTRLNYLKKELETIKSLQCLAFNVKEEAVKYYEKEIECIEEYGSANPDYTDAPARKFFNIDLINNSEAKND